MRYPILESQTLHLQVLQVSLQIQNMQSVSELMIQILHRQLRIQVLPANRVFIFGQFLERENRNSRHPRKTRMRKLVARILVRQALNPQVARAIHQMQNMESVNMRRSQMPRQQFHLKLRASLKMC